MMPNINIIITQWALNSYLDLSAQRVFTPQEYRNDIRPDVLLLKVFPNHTKFQNSKFWSVAQEKGQILSDGYKMKWHQIGQGRIQLRLPVGILTDAFLCGAYVKQHAKQEQRQLAKFKTYLQLIRQNQYTECGRLS